MLILSILASCMFTKEAYIRGNSMLPEYKPNQKIEIELGHYRCNKKIPNENDVIVFNHLNKEYIKRVAAISGDKLSFKNKFLYVNNQKKEFKLTEKEQRLLSLYSIVPKGSVLIFGDNLKHSKDSRSFGPIPISSIVGKVK